MPNGGEYICVAPVPNKLEEMPDGSEYNCVAPAPNKLEEMPDRSQYFRINIFEELR